MIDLDILSLYLQDYPIEEISPLIPSEFLRRADINRDGVINMADFVLLKTLVYS